MSERQFRVWRGGLSGRIFAGWCRWDGRRWVAIDEKHDVTADVLAIAADALMEEPDEAEATDG